MAGFFRSDARLRDGGLDMPTWREDALKGAALGALIFLGVALLLGGAAWFFR
jgi:hypothetical protein